MQCEYDDVDGQLHRADPAALACVVEMLDADRAAADAVPRVGPPLHLSTHGPLPIDAVVNVAAVSVGGQPIELASQRFGAGSTIELPADLPLGCHVVEYETDAGPGETVVVVAPPTMPRAERFAGRSGVFAPTYALWERDRPLPSFANLHRLARDLKRLGIDVVATLPLSATFLDDPYDPSPYSPVSRLHWNELYLDDAGLPPAPVAPQGSHVDWRTLAERRRAQLVEAARSADFDVQLTAFVSAHPDVGAYARFRAQREADGDELVARSHVLAQYLADQQLRAITDDPEAAVARARPADRIEPTRLRGVGRPVDVRNRGVGRGPARLLLRRRAELGLPATAAGRDALERSPALAPPDRAGRSPL